MTFTMTAFENVFKHRPAELWPRPELSPWSIAMTHSLQPCAGPTLTISMKMHRRWRSGQRKKMRLLSAKRLKAAV
jgi:hypothetical protein